MVKGTSKVRASVCASRVLPQPVGPTSRMFDLASSTSPPFARVLEPLVVVVHRDREHALGAASGRSHNRRACSQMSCGVGHAAVLLAERAGLGLFADDVVAQLDAFVADEHGRAGDELPHLVLRLAAEASSRGCSCCRDRSVWSFFRPVPAPLSARDLPLGNVARGYRQYQSA